jgi:hypothetical protein
VRLSSWDETDDRETDLASFIAGQELSTTEVDKDQFSTTRDAVIALTELSGLGYEAEFAIKAAWMRGIDSDEDPFFRAKELAVLKYDSRDADLLPAREESTDLWLKTWPKSRRTRSSPLLCR